METALRSFQEEVLRDVLGPKLPDDPALLLYRQLTRTSIVEALEAIYSFTKKTVEGTTWNQWADQFITECWSEDFRLNWAVKKFPEWISSFTYKGTCNIGTCTPWLQELADYEWCRFQALNSRDPHSDEWLNPSLVIRSYECPIPLWYKYAIEENLIGGDNPVKLQEKKSSSVAIFREPENYSLKVLELQPAALELLSHWMTGESPETSAQLLANQLKKTAHQVLIQMKPLLEMLGEAGILFLEGRKNTRSFVI